MCLAPAAGSCFAGTFAAGSSAEGAAGRVVVAVGSFAVVGVELLFVASVAVDAQMTVAVTCLAEQKVRLGPVPAVGKSLVAVKASPCSFFGHWNSIRAAESSTHVN